MSNSSKFIAIIDRVAYFILPIGRLDLDALRLIFELVADDSRPKYDQPLSDSWARLGHVCHVWRSTLLSMPELWARDVLAFGAGSALDDVFSRARDMPLHLDFSARKRHIRRIAPLIPRAEVLKCEMESFEEQQIVLDSILSHPPTALHTLALRVDHRTRYVQQPSPQHATCVQHLPIRHLEMYDLFLSPPLSGTLTSWTMHSNEQSWIVDRRLSIATIVNVLAHNTGLERIFCRDAISIFDRDAAEPHVVLPALKVLQIWQNDNAPPYTLLSHMRFPNPILEQCSIHDFAFDTPSELSTAFTSALSACDKSSALESAHFLRVIFDATRSGEVLIQLEPRHRVAYDSTSVIPFDLKFETEGSCLQLSSVIMDALVNFRIATRITELLWSAHEEDAQTIEYWNTVLRPFSCVETLFLGDSQTTIYHHCFPALIATFDALASTRSDGPLLPRLHRLVTSAWETDGLAYIEMPRVVRTLQRRAEMGVPVSEIRFLDIGGPENSSANEDPEFVASVFEQMEKLAADLGVGVESRERWEDIEGKRRFGGTDFVFHY
ncbi:hypothetical protein PENSPDRAFT_290455 [Peniophora sp. CONT]|nr:hypothetical protein PENSPDRAFT_290455 [Peniophora sp. CONT]